MSFSNEVKNELARLENGKQCCEKSRTVWFAENEWCYYFKRPKYGYSFFDRKCCFSQACASVV